MATPVLATAITPNQVPKVARRSFTDRGPNAPQRLPKLAGETLDFTLKLNGDLEAGETITYCMVTPMDDLIAIEQAQRAPRAIVVFVSGGTDETLSRVKIEYTTSRGVEAIVYFDVGLREGVLASPGEDFSDQITSAAVIADLYAMSKDLRKWYRLAGTGPAVGAWMNVALADLEEEGAGKTLELPAGMLPVEVPVVGTNVLISGNGGRSLLYPTSAMGITDDILTITYDYAGVSQWGFFGNFAIAPWWATGGPPGYGRHALTFHWEPGSYPIFDINRIEIGFPNSNVATALSLRSFNEVADNPQGGPSACHTFRNLILVGGAFMQNVGDSSRWENCHFGSWRTGVPGLEWSASGDGVRGQAGGHTFLNCNAAGSAGPFLLFHSGRSIVLDNFNCDLHTSATGGTDYRAHIVALGDEDWIDGFHVRGGGWQNFGASTAKRFMYVGRVDGFSIDNTRFANASVVAASPYAMDEAVYTSASAVNASIGNDLVYEGGAGFTSKVTNLGTGTRGVLCTQAATITASVGTVTSATGTWTYCRKGNRVLAHLQVVIVTNGSGATTLLATLPTNAGTAASVYWTGGGHFRIGGSGVDLKCRIDNNFLAIWTYDNLYPGGDTRTLELDIEFEVI